MKKFNLEFLKKGAVLLLSAVLLAGCGTYSTDTVTVSNDTKGTDAKTEDVVTEVATQEKTINIAISSDPSFTFNAIGDSLMVTNGLLREGLTRHGDGQIVDGLAESYEHNEDYTQWTFKLRESGWSNGDSVKADDWVYAIGAMLSGEAEIGYPDFLFEIKNARAIYTGEADVSTLGITAVDDKTVAFDLEYPVTYFPSLITHPMHFGYSRAFSEQVGVDKVGTEAEYSVSNGPFYIDSWKHNDVIVFKKNPYYWNKDNIAIDQVNVYVIPDESTQVNLFLNGEIDIVDFSYQRLSALTNAGNEALTYNNGRSAYLYYNLTNTYLQNVNIRRAISAAIDREAIVNGVLHIGTAADGLVPIGLSGDGTKTFRDIVGSSLEYTYNLDNAKALLQKGLDELGLQSPSDVSITILAKNTDEFISVTGAVQQLLKENLGINVEVETTDGTSFSARRKAFDYDVYLASWGADWDDATNFLGGYEKDASANDALYKSEAFNEAYQKAVYATDLTKRVELLGEAEKILLEDQAITPLYYTGQYYAVSEKISGVLRRAVVPYLDLYFADVK